ncbi:hypothetical protein C1O63_0245 [Dehalococcoides mccartyi]|nr:hypothetical protein C1O63_0245 [Dehalococcoides mccartyi]
MQPRCILKSQCDNLQNTAGAGGWGLFFSPLFYFQRVSFEYCREIIFRRFNISAFERVIIEYPV